MSTDIEAINAQNQTVLETMKPGDLLEFDRGIYQHWAVCAGDGKVIHKRVVMDDNSSSEGVPEVGDDDDDDDQVDSVAGIKLNQKQKDFLRLVMEDLPATITVDDFHSVTFKSPGVPSPTKISNYMDNQQSAASADDILSRANSKLGNPDNDTYNLLVTNCEHFATWCRYGERESVQIEKLSAGIQKLLAKQGHSWEMPDVTGLSADERKQAIIQSFAEVNIKIE